MRLGIGSYTYAWAVGVSGQMPEKPLNPLDILKKAAALKVRVAQFCDNLSLAGLSQAELDQFSAFACEHGISIELGTRGIDVENLSSQLELALKFRSPFVRVVVDSKDFHPSSEETIALLRQTVPMYAGAGIKLAIENHDRFTAATLVRIVESLGPEHAGICLDTVNSFGALEGPATVVKTLAPYTLNLHVKDFTVQRVSSQMGFVVAGCAAGQGRLDVPWLLDELHSAGRDVDAILELWTPFGPTLSETIERENDMADQSVNI